MAEPVAKKKKVFMSDSIFTDFRKGDDDMEFLRKAFKTFISSGNDLKFKFIEIIDANARSGVSFSDASCFVTSYKQKHNKYTDAPLVYMLSSLFPNGTEILNKYLLDDDNYMLPIDKEPKIALAKLLTFFKSSYKFFKPKPEGQSKCEWALQLAQHLLVKIAVDSNFTVDNCYSENTVTLDGGILLCPCGAREQIENGTFGDTSFGCANAWHGNADILFENTSVKLVDNPDSTKPSPDSSEDASQSSKDVKCGGKFSSRDDEQLLAQSIVFSFLQQKQFPDAENFLTPSLAFSRDKVKIIFYDCEHDILLQTGEIPLFACHMPCTSTVILLWLTLNYRYLCRGLPEVCKAFKAKFFDRVGDHLIKYKNEVTKPAHTVRKVIADENWVKLDADRIVSLPSTIRFCRKN